MHELSIAMNIVEICTEEAEKAEAKRVSRVELEVGNLAGIEIDALEFSWDVAVQNSLLEGAELMIQKVEAKARCVECTNEFVLADVFGPCPSCGQYRIDILTGKELKIKALTVE